MKKLLFIAIAALGMFACTEQNGLNSQVAKNGALPGKFSVSANKQVQFSQGNVQYQASTNTWRFAENQYDAVGVSNADVSPVNDGWIDLFGWGTGNNPTLSSVEEQDYPIFVDWGINKISNGGNRANMWRTLTKDEWVYLFESRANAALLFGLGSVNGVRGVIILPDNWLKSHRGIVNTNNFSDNSYTIEEWSAMESANAVFLPACGFRYEVDVHKSEYGFYWSATRDTETTANVLYFCLNGFDPQSYGSLARGFSVRLVRNY